MHFLGPLIVLNLIVVQEKSLRKKMNWYIFNKWHLLQISFHELKLDVKKNQRKREITMLK